MKILVTGSEGGVGRALIPILQAQGHTICGLDVVETAHSDYDYTSGDLRDFETVKRVATGADAVIHAGAIANDRKDLDHEVLASNAQGTWNVLIAAVKNEIPRVIHFSSINALGCVGGRQRPKYLPIDDAYPRHPNSPYQIGKHLGEEACKAFSSRWGITTISLRPMWINRGHSQKGWMHHLSASEREQRLWSELWAYVDMRDVCDATLRSLTVEGVQHEAFLLAGADTISLTPTLELVERHLSDIPWRVPKAEWFAENPRRGLLDISHAEEILGWVPQHTLLGDVPQDAEIPRK
jgi:nucleoside-diphosphate-sugar epimerase